jgi:hypothetical protein
VESPALKHEDRRVRAGPRLESGPTCLVLPHEIPSSCVALCGWLWSLQWRDPPPPSVTHPTLRHSAVRRPADTRTPHSPLVSRPGSGYWPVIAPFALHGHGRSRPAGNADEAAVRAVTGSTPVWAAGIGLGCSRQRGRHTGKARMTDSAHGAHERGGKTHEDPTGHRGLQQSDGDPGRLISAVHLAVIDFRDLRRSADERSGRP